MEKVITAYPIEYDFDDRAFKIKIPTTCPCCGTAYQTEPLTSFYIGPSRSGYASEIYSMYFCSACGKVFMSRSIGDGYNVAASLAQVLPDRDTPVTSFSDAVSDCSPRFVDIYNQSEIAEQKGLLEICGMGYRKALEFLLKDFAISNSPDSEETIKKLSLSDCISSHIPEKRIQDLAKASSWIGNDEVHYVRKHGDYSISDMKDFITILVAYIDSELVIKKAQTLVKRV